MTYQIDKITMDKEFKICPNCGYEDGFHSMFERIENGGKLSWKLICPNCHKIFDIDLKARTES
jgi:ribosomal protein S27AE